MAFKDMSTDRPIGGHTFSGEVREHVADGDRTRLSGEPPRADKPTPNNLTAFDLMMVEQSQRLRCLKAAVSMGENTGGTAKQVLADAQRFYNWVTMTPEEYQAQASADAQAEREAKREAIQRMKAAGPHRFDPEPEAFVAGKGGGMAV